MTLVTSWGKRKRTHFQTLIFLSTNIYIFSSFTKLSPDSWKVLFISKPIFSCLMCKLSLVRVQTTYENYLLFSRFSYSFKHLHKNPQNRNQQIQTHASLSLPPQAGKQLNNLWSLRGKLLLPHRTRFLWLISGDYQISLLLPTFHGGPQGRSLWSS